MQVHASKIDDIRILRPDVARIDVSVADAFKAACLEQMRPDEQRVVLDLSQVGFIDSKGLGQLIALHKSMDEGASMAIAAPARQVRKVFELTKLDRVFPLAESLQSATALLKG